MHSSIAGGWNPALHKHVTAAVVSGLYRDSGQVTTGLPTRSLWPMLFLMSYTIALGSMSCCAQCRLQADQEQRKGLGQLQ